MFCFADSAGKSLFSPQPVSQPTCGSFMNYPGFQPTPPDSRSTSPLHMDERAGELFMVSKRTLIILCSDFHYSAINGTYLLI